MIHLEPRHHEIVRKILKQADARFFAFGSRVKGTHRPFSDLDLCYMDPVPTSVLNKIEADFVESDLPFVVDIVDYQKCSLAFQKIIDNDAIIFE